MIQSAERIFLMGDKSAIGAALFQRLLYLGHPRSHIRVMSNTQMNWADADAVSAFLRKEQPDLMYLVDAAGCSSGAEASVLPSAELISAAAQAGVARLMYVGTAAQQEGAGSSLAHQNPGRSGSRSHTTALQRCALLVSQGLDYRSVSTCEPYGPNCPATPRFGTAPAAALIEDLLLQFTDAVVKGIDRVTIQANPGDRLELMYLNDIAEAVVHVMDLPHGTLTQATRAGSLHVNIGAGHVVGMLELINAVAAAVGFQGRFQLESAPMARCSHGLDHLTMADLGWRPLISLETGLELAAMEFRLRHRSPRNAPCTT
jgi:GDP-L-fucose synthase